MKKLQNQIQEGIDQELIDLRTTQDIRNEAGIKRNS